MPARLHHGDDPERLLKVICQEPSHNGRETLITRFREEVAGTGERVNIDMVQSVRRTRSGVELTTQWTRHGDFNPGNSPKIGRNPHPPSALLTLVDERGRPTDGRDRPAAASRDSHWQYQLRCPTCGMNVSTRSTTLMPVLHKLFDADMLIVQLRSLAAIVAR